MSNDPKLQPIRLWYEYLKTALKYNMKVTSITYRQVLKKLDEYI